MKTASKTNPLLDVPMYSFSEAGHLLGVPAVTITSWVKGTATRKPVIREDREFVDAVTWGDFIESALLREYRKLGASLQGLRPLMAKARERFGYKYPLAELKPLLDHKKRLIWDLQHEEDIPEDVYLVEDHRDQLVLADTVLRFLDRVKYSIDGVPTAYSPAGPNSSIRVDPDVTFGLPQIKGVRTETLAEMVASGMDVASVAQTYGLNTKQVKEAVEWENRSLAPA